MSGIPTHPWRELYRAALLEPNPDKLEACLDEAEREIKQRLRDLVVESGASGEERRELENAIHNLRMRKKEKDRARS